MDWRVVKVASTPKTVKLRRLKRLSLENSMYPKCSHGNAKNGISDGVPKLSQNSGIASHGATLDFETSNNHAIKNNMCENE